ncbi:MAG: hypothetical protein MZV49_20835 [Rhodopseudomonas palustris]|nr:hypothetical protein [Rhodopseudomonas palustris]
MTSVTGARIEGKTYAANLTIRQLDEATKSELRQRAALNGRSMEDEVRGILREAALQSPSAEPAPSDEHRARRADAHRTGRAGQRIAAHHADRRRRRPPPTSRWI